MINPKLVDFICGWEGFSSKSYPDPGSKDGLPVTIGYGTTLINGEPIAMGTTCTKEEAWKWIQEELEEKRKLLVVYPGYGLMKPEQQDAILSFVYNLGMGCFKNSSVADRIRRGKLAEVPARMTLYSYNDGKYSGGLYRRRQAEVAIFLRADYSGRP